MYKHVIIWSATSKNPWLCGTLSVCILVYVLFYLKEALLRNWIIQVEPTHENNNGNFSLKLHNIATANLVTQSETTTTHPLKIFVLGTSHFSRKFANQDFSMCKNRTYKFSPPCVLISDKKQLNQSDVIIFLSLFAERGHYTFWPAKRPNYKQKWAFYGRESAFRSASSQVLANYDNLFNLTITYRSNSDLVIPYGSCNVKDIKYWGSGVPSLLTIRKRKFVVAVISNCNTQSEREVYIKELHKYIPIDFYGECYNSSVPHTTKAFTELVKTYKFNLAFENSLCEEYITEKAFRTLSIGAVPIVSGYGNYSSVLPANSYINVKDYESPRHLAHYLLTLHNNDIMYQELHKWRKYRTCRKESTSPCRICEYFVQHRYQTQLVPSLKNQWFDERDCISSDEFYRGIL